MFYFTLRARRGGRDCGLVQLHLPDAGAGAGALPTRPGVHHPHLLDARLDVKVRYQLLLWYPAGAAARARSHVHLDALAVLEVLLLLKLLLLLRVLA